MARREALHRPPSDDDEEGAIHESPERNTGRNARHRSNNNEYNNNDYRGHQPWDAPQAAYADNSSSNHSHNHYRGGGGRGIQSMSEPYGHAGHGNPRQHHQQHHHQQQQYYNDSRHSTHAPRHAGRWDANKEPIGRGRQQHPRGSQSSGVYDRSRNLQRYDDVPHGEPVALPDVVMDNQGRSRSKTDYDREMRGSGGWGGRSRDRSKERTWNSGDFRGSINPWGSVEDNSDGGWGPTDQPANNGRIPAARGQQREEANAGPSSNAPSRGVSSASSFSSIRSSIHSVRNEPGRSYGGSVNDPLSASSSRRVSLERRHNKYPNYNTESGSHTHTGSRDDLLNTRGQANGVNNYSGKPQRLSDGDFLFQQQWLFSDEDLKNTPSRMDGISERDEWILRFKGCKFISTVGLVICNRWPRVVSVACIYFHRFFMRKSFKDYPYKVIAATCLYITTSMEDYHTRLSHIVGLTLVQMNKKKKLDEMNSGALADDTKVNNEQDAKMFEELRSMIRYYEGIVLETICFDFIDCPLTLLMDTLQPFYHSFDKKDTVRTNLINTCQTVFHDIHLTPLCVQYGTKVTCVATLIFSLLLLKVNLKVEGDNPDQQRAKILEICDCADNKDAECVATAVKKIVQMYDNLSDYLSAPSAPK